MLLPDNDSPRRADANDVARSAGSSQPSVSLVEPIAGGRLEGMVLKDRTSTYRDVAHDRLDGPVVCVA